jgi:hypothetical protein
MAAEIAANLAEGYIAPIAGKIDPLTLGEHQRAVQIGYDYGERLNEKVNSLKKDALVKLVSNYPSHSFVIDRKEARTLFNCVLCPKDGMSEVYTWARSIIETKEWPNDPLVIDLEVLFSPKEEENENQSCNKEKSDNCQLLNDDGNLDEDSCKEGDPNESDADNSDSNKDGKDRGSNAQQNAGEGPGSQSGFSEVDN